MTIDSQLRSKAISEIMSFWLDQYRKSTGEDAPDEWALEHATEFYDRVVQETQQRWESHLGEIESYDKEWQEKLRKFSLVMTLQQLKFYAQVYGVSEETASELVVAVTGQG